MMVSADIESKGAPSSSSERSLRRTTVAWLVVLAAAASGPYLHTLHNDFVFDDRIVVVINGRQWQHEGLWKLLHHDYWGDQRIDSLYRPITTVSHVLNYRLSGEHPVSYRAVNIGLHAACCVCLFGVTRTLWNDHRLAGIGALLFAVHALHVEPVAQIVGRAELLSGLWTLLALWFYVTDARRGVRGPSWRYGMVLIFSAAAMLSKENGISAVGLPMVYDLWSRRFARCRAQVESACPGAVTARRHEVLRAVRHLVWTRWLGLFMIALIVFVIRFSVLGRISRRSADIPKLDNPIAHASLTGRVLTPVVLLGKYVRLMIWPNPLCCDYSYDALPICESPFDPRFLWGFACMMLLVVAAVRSYRRSGRVLWCVLFFLVGYLLVSNTVVLIGTIFAERLMYLPLAAFCWLAAIGIVAVGDRIPTRVRSIQSPVRIIVPAVAVLCAVHVFLTVQRGKVWRDERSLLASALALTQDSARVQIQAGVYAMSDRDSAAAIHHLQRAVEILDDHPPGHYQLGRAYLQARQFDRAISHLKRAYGKLAAEANSKPAYYIGQAYLGMNLPGLAVPWFALADKHEPDSPSILSAWAIAATAAGDHPQAVEVLTRALRVTPPTHQLYDGFRRQLKDLTSPDSSLVSPGR